jgi:hypothetical protein
VVGCGFWENSPPEIFGYFRGVAHSNPRQFVFCAFIVDAK